MFKDINDENEMKQFGEKLGASLCGGEIIELVGDVGAGKTTLTKGIAAGLGVKDNVQSPSFTISRVYEGRDDLIMAHYDFYRLGDAGIMGNELDESMSEPGTVTIIEWANVVGGILPDDRLSINIMTLSEDSRRLVILAGGEKSRSLIERLK